MNALLPLRPYFDRWPFYCAMSARTCCDASTHRTGIMNVASGVELMSKHHHQFIFVMHSFDDDTFECVSLWRLGNNTLIRRYLTMCHVVVL